MTTPAYDFVEGVLRTPRQVIWRGVRRADGLRVLIKEQASSRRTARLQQELDLTQQLTLNSVPRRIELARLGPRDSRSGRS